MELAPIPAVLKPWEVLVHFSVDAFARSVGRRSTEEEAHRLAREYLGGDAKSIRVNGPNGETYLKGGAR